ncbi:MAG: HAD hydrolase family protein [Coriobacteriales bacterium]
MTPTPLHLDDSGLVREALARASILFTDVDGTLVAPGGVLLADASGAPSLATAEAVVELNRAGLSAVITTGRNRPQCGEITRLLGWRAFIAELGCVVQFDRSQEPEYLMGDWPEDALQPGETPFQAMIRAGALQALTREFPGRIEEHTPWHTDRVATHVLRGNVDRDQAQAALDRLDLPIDIVDNGIVNPPRHTLVGVSEIHAYHLVPRGSHKTTAITRVLERRGLTREDAVSIGDSATEVEMADVTALCVLVGNALDDERVRAAAAARDNVAVTQRQRGEGWAEFVWAWLSARRD